MTKTTGTKNQLAIVAGEIVTVYACVGETLVTPKRARVALVDGWTDGRLNFYDVETGEVLFHNSLTGSRKATISRD